MCHGATGSSSPLSLTHSSQFVNYVIIYDSPTLWSALPSARRAVITEYVTSSTVQFYVACGNDIVVTSLWLALLSTHLAVHERLAMSSGLLVTDTNVNTV